IDYYRVTFDHLVSPHDRDPEVLVVKLVTRGGYADGRKFANEALAFSVNPSDDTGKRVLAVPTYCRHEKSTQDRFPANDSVAER
ncbi:hypothetical protein LX36DRAFT_539759, partial [Colletotrichum falcatum]